MRPVDFVFIVVGISLQLGLALLFEKPILFAIAILQAVILAAVIAYYRLESKKSATTIEGFLGVLVSNQDSELDSVIFERPLWKETGRYLKMIRTYLKISRQSLEDRQHLYEEMENRLYQNKQRLDKTETELKNNEQRLEKSEYRVLESTLALQHINIIQHKIQGRLNIDELLNDALELLMSHLSIHRGFFLKIDLQSQQGVLMNPINTPYSDLETVSSDALWQELHKAGMDNPPEQELDQVPLLVLDQRSSPFMEIAFESAVLIPVWIDRELWGGFCLFEKETRIKSSQDRSFGSFGDSDHLVLQNVVAFLQRDLKTAYLFEMATVDSLSQLYVRRYFDNRMEDELRRVRRHPSVFSLLLLDIDLFKTVNDTFGHLVGDEVIRAVADVLKEQLRHGLDLSARYGGEEMVVLLPHTDTEAAQLVAERIRMRIEELEMDAMSSRTSPQVTASLGVSTYPTHGTTARELLEAADRALYRAKESGRNQVCLAKATHE